MPGPAKLSPSQCGLLLPACLPRLAPSCSLLHRHQHPLIHRVLSAVEAEVPHPPCPERGPSSLLWKGCRKAVLTAPK